MKNLLLLIVVLVFLSPNLVSAQSHSEKYNSVYDRYDFIDSNGNLIGYRKENAVYNRWDYFDNNGNLRGYYKWNDIYDRWDFTEIKSNTGNTSSNTGGRYVVHDYGQPQSYFNTNLAIQALAYKQARYDKQLSDLQRQKAQAEEVEREKAINRMNQIINYYNDAKSLPINIKDGWHLVFAMNNYDFCDQRKVYVENNKITKYVIDDWSHRTVTYSLPIQYAKTSIKLKEADDELLNIFFVEAINNPNVTAAPPIKAGKINFFTNYRKGQIDVFVEGYFIGTIKKSFKEGTPSCGQDGTVVYENKPGTYNYVAKSSRHTWKGTITISGSSCSSKKLLK